MRKLVFAAALLAAACSKKDEAAAPPAAAAPAAAAPGEGGEGADTDPVDSVTLEPEAPVAGQNVIARVADGRGRQIYFTWYVNGEELVGERNDRIDGKYVKKGARIKVSTIPMIGEVEGEKKESGEITVGNTAPKIDAVDVVSNEPGRLALQVRAEDVDGDSLTYRLVGAPAGMSIDASGAITWAIPADYAGGVTFTVGASDGEFEFTYENSIGTR